MWFPEMPAGPDARGEMSLRYEDVTQDGRLVLEALPTAIGTVTWRALMKELGDKLRGPSDVVPILSRLVVHSQGGPLSVHPPLQGRGTYALAHTVDASGAVDRIFLNLWALLDGVIGNTHGFWVDRAGETVAAGRVFAEHIFTRPFAPAAERKVTALTVPSFPAVPPDRYAFRSPETLLADVPADTVWLDAEARAEQPAAVFGLVHTDSNQHVNSLVYPRLFEDAALRRLAAHGVRNVLARYAELSFRKPCFAGEAIDIVLQAGRAGEQHVVRGWFAAPGDAKPRAFVRMVLTG